MYKGIIKFKQIVKLKELKKQAGFTMSEVLITLGIVGIIAAMTLPALIGKYQKHVTVNKLKKSYTTLAQMFVRTQEDNGGMETWDFSNIVDYSQGTAFNEVLPKIAQTYFLPYLDVLQDCGTSCKRVSKNNYKWLNNQLINQYASHLYYTIFLKDGSIIFFSLNNNGVKLFDLIISVDINGDKGPNVSGKDVFHYYLNADQVSRTNFWGLTGTNVKRETLLKDSGRGCNKNGTGQYCGALIQYDGWKISDDYPW